MEKEDDRFILPGSYWMSKHRCEISENISEGKRQKEGTRFGDLSLTQNELPASRGVSRCLIESGGVSQRLFKSGGVLQRLASFRGVIARPRLTTFFYFWRHPLAYHHIH